VGGWTNEYRWRHSDYLPDDTCVELMILRLAGDPIDLLRM
jgi:hypothetical protein